MNGAVERMIGILKRAMDVTLPPCLLRSDELQTFVSGIEAAMNCRPLVDPVGIDPRDDRPLTPNDFLTGSQFPELAPLPEQGKRGLLARHALVMKTLDDHWARFRKELIPQIRQLNNLTAKKNEFKKGDIVIVLQEKDRGRWPRARVEEVSVSPRDGVVREMKVWMDGKLSTRSAHEVLRLEVFDPRL